MKSDYARNQQRLTDLKKKLNSSGHKSLGDWIFNEISGLYNSEPYKKKLNAFPKNQPVLKTGNQKLVQDADRSGLTKTIFLERLGGDFWKLQFRFIFEVAARICKIPENSSGNSPGSALSARVGKF
jgi:hypothetical protein